MSEEVGYIEIKLDKFKDGQKYTLSDVDISELKQLIDDFENLVTPDTKDKRSRPHIYYKQEEGSVVNKFFLGLVYVAQFSGILNQFSESNNLNFLDRKRAEIIDRFQRDAVEKSITITLSSSQTKAQPLEITPETNYFLPKDEYYETQLYVYGMVYDMGGKTTPNVHIDTKEYGTLKVEATKEQLIGKDQHLYQVTGLVVHGEQNHRDGTLKNLKFLDFIRYEPKAINREVWKLKIKNSTKAWSDIEDVDKWLKQIRGYDE